MINNDYEEVRLRYTARMNNVWHEHVQFTTVEHSCLWFGFGCDQTTDRSRLRIEIDITVR